MVNCVVVTLKEPVEGADEQVEVIVDADLHVSSHGVLVVRDAKTGQTLRTYSSDAWYSAVAGKHADQT